jgi:hypothetical protein
MEGGDAGGDAGAVGMDGADVSAPEQGDSGLTTTTSGGIPIAPVYAGGMVPYGYPSGYSSSGRSRRREFMSQLQFGGF